MRRSTGFRTGTAFPSCSATWTVGPTRKRRATSGMSGRDGEKPAGTRPRAGCGTGSLVATSALRQVVMGAMDSSETASAAEQRTILGPIAQSALRVRSGTPDGAWTASAAVRSLANGVTRSMILTKLKWVAATLLAVALAGSGASRFAAWASGEPPILTEHLPGGGGRPEAPPIQDASPAAARPSKPAITQERSVPPFDAIRVSGDIQAVVMRGKERRVTAVGDPEFLRALRTMWRRPSRRMATA